MRKLIKFCISVIARSGIMWRILRPIVLITSHYNFQRRRELRRRAELELQILFEDFLINHGVFKGMVYPSHKSIGSSLYPKYAGSYESELEQVICYLGDSYSYKTIINIGAAEGYYAVGLAMRFKDAQVYAYDLKPDYGLTIDELARLNNVESRINYLIAKENYTFEELMHDERSLVICDCEGCEREVFSTMNLDKLINTDLIIPKLSDL